MKIFVTNNNLIWDVTVPILKGYEKDTIVVKMDSIHPINENFKIIEPHYSKVGLGHDSYSLNSLKYRALELLSNEIVQFISQDEDVLVLANNDPITLYIFKVLQNINRQNLFKLHLWATLPFKFEGTLRNAGCRNLLSDTKYLKSLLIFDCNEYLKEMPKTPSMPKVFKLIIDKFNRLLPQVVNEINNMRNYNYFFDMTKEHYINIIPSESLPPIEPITFSSNNYDMSKTIKESILHCNPRVDGKEICNILRKMRIEFAKNNGINFISENCDYDGPCAGTCQKCEQEIKYLEKHSEKLLENGNIIYPYYNIKDLDYKTREPKKIKNIEKHVGVKESTHGVVMGQEPIDWLLNELNKHR